MIKTAIYDKTISMTNTKTRSKQQQINEVIGFISLFRNKVIELQIPQYFYSIPTIFAIYQHIYKKLKNTYLFDQKFCLNPQFLAQLFKAISNINLFYSVYESQVQSKPNLLYLFAIGALSGNSPKFSVNLSKAQRNNKLFPHQYITQKSSKAEINQLIKYSDWFHTAPDISIINRNYQYSQGTYFGNHIKA